MARVYSVQRGVDGVPQLCAESLAGNRMVSRCLVEGVEQLQFEYGIDSDRDGAPELFVAAPAASELPRVVAVRVHLLLRSIRALADHRDRFPHELGETRVPAADDRFLRRVLSSTVALDRAVRHIARAG